VASIVTGATLIMVALAALGGALFGRYRDKRVRMAILSLVAVIVGAALLSGCRSTPTPTPTPPQPRPQEGTPTEPPTAVPPTISPLPTPGPLTSPVQPAQIPPGETKVPASGRIAFHSDKSGNFDIWVMNADGTDMRQLTTAPGRDIEPAWSPDGSRIVFASDRDDPDNLQLYIMDANGSNQRRLFQEVFAWDNWGPAWSPDGTRVAFQTNRNLQATRFDIYVANADGSDERPLVQGPANEFHPFWSPDGKKLAYVSDAADSRDIWVVNADGSNPVQLTSGYADETYPRWSPDGQWILFQSNREGYWRLFAMRPDGSDLRRVSVPLPSDDVMGTWSPDGNYIAFSSNRANKDWEIYIMPVGGDTWQRLTFNFPLIFDRYPAWTK